MYGMMSYVFLILILLQYTTSRIFRPVKPWTGGYLEEFTNNAKVYTRLPWNKSRVEANWKNYTQEEDKDLNLTMICPRKSKETCALLDGYGNIAGIQVNAPSQHFKTKNISPNQLQHFQIKTIDGRLYSSLTIYFVVHRTLKKGGRQRRIKYLGIGLWIQSGFQTLELPLNKTDLVENQWMEQSCVTGKGTYYLKAAENSTDCYNPYVPTLYKNQIVGMTFLIPGQCPRALKKKASGRISSFIGLSESDVQELFPNAPSCLKVAAKAQGLCSAHVGFVATPPNNGITCPKTLVEHAVNAAEYIIDQGLGFLRRLG